VESTTSKNGHASRSQILRYARLIQRSTRSVGA